MTPAPIALPPADWTPPATSYLLCTTPRSGSTFLCRLLRVDGGLGRPDEHFAEDRNLEPRRAGAAAWMGAVLAEGRGANGVFGCKLFPPHLVALGEEAGVRPADWLPDLRYLHLRRQDLLGQAISFAIATQTGHWVPWGRPDQAREPRYDAGLIARLLDRVVEWEGYWRRCFALTGVTPLELVYEEVAARPQAALAAIRQWLGLPAAPEAAPAPERRAAARVQRTQRNEEWRQRFLADLARSGYRLADRPARARPGLRSLRAWLAGELALPPFGLPDR